MRGATRSRQWANRCMLISIHAPHAGRDAHNANNKTMLRISIHAPHAGRDFFKVIIRCIRVKFQSTRPMRGATVTSPDARLQRPISIHAPHAGRDLMDTLTDSEYKHFNPRAPCGARRRWKMLKPSDLTFQSTRPMRGAT